MKRFARRVINWRPYQAVRSMYNFICRKTGQRGDDARAYKSSPMEQLLNRMVFQEDSWADTTSVFARPEKLRLRNQLKSCKLKCEVADEISMQDAMSFIEAVRVQMDASV